MISNKEKKFTYSTTKKILKKHYLRCTTSGKVFTKDCGCKKTKKHSNSRLNSYSNVLMSILRVVQSCLSRLLFASHPPPIADSGRLFYFC